MKGANEAFGERRKRSTRFLQGLDNIDVPVGARSHEIRQQSVKERINELKAPPWVSQTLRHPQQ
jgi:hypothetical protein